MSNKLDKQRQHKQFLQPYTLPQGIQEGDLVAVTQDGEVVALCPEVLGCDWETIRSRLAGFDRNKLPTIQDLKRDRNRDS